MVLRAQTIHRKIVFRVKSAQPTNAKIAKTSSPLRKTQYAQLAESIVGLPLADWPFSYTIPACTKTTHPFLRQRGYVMSREMKHTLIRSVLVIVFIASAVAVQGLNGHAMTSLSQDDLDLHIGGACFGCLPQDFCKKDVPCTETSPGSGVWYKYDAQGITQKFCYDREKFNTPGNGYKICRTQNPQDCVKAFTCTDSACNNCGPPSTERKDTECNFIPGAPCTVTAG